MDNQKQEWERIHGSGNMDEFRTRPSNFVVSTTQFMDPGATILELGCGTGGDARYLTDQGYPVVATDFSEAVIEENRRYFKDIRFEVVDINSTLPFDNQSFDIIYANLSLHYFDDTTTHDIFREIHRVLTIGGKLIFRCKSIYSELEKIDAEEIGSNIYLQRGHLRHLFSTEYVAELFKNTYFRELRNDYVSGEVYGKKAFFVEAVGQKVDGEEKHDWHREGARNFARSHGIDHTKIADKSEDLYAFLHKSEEV